MGEEPGGRSACPGETRFEPETVSDFQFVRPKAMARQRGRQNSRRDGGTGLSGQASDFGAGQKGSQASPPRVHLKRRIFPAVVLAPPEITLRQTLGAR